MYDPTVSPPRTFDQLISFILFYGFLAALGVVALVFLLVLFFWPQWRVNTQFVESEALVVDLRDVRSEGGGFRQVRLRHFVRDVEFESWNRSTMTFGMDAGRIQKRVRAMAVGERHPVWYDPGNPKVMVVERGYWIHWALYPIIVGAGFFVLYGVGKIVAGVRRFRAQ